jgi:CheY-like chemotaxis protein
MEIPCSPVHAGKSMKPDESKDSSEHQQLRGRILLVDDNETNLMLGEMLLNRMGLNVICASSGEIAVETVRDQDPDLVLMDLSMPGIDGFEATRQIRTFRDARSLPVVALTAYASSVERELSEACGMDGYLTKPIVVDEMYRTLSTWLPQGEAKAESPNQPSRGTETVTLLDQAVLNDLAGQIGNANLVRVIDKFLEEVDERWAAVERATTPAELAREAHALASTCRSFGLPSIGDKIACIERHARLGESAGEPPCIATTGQELLQGTSALKLAMARYQADD